MSKQAQISTKAKTILDKTHRKYRTKLNTVLKTIVAKTNKFEEVEVIFWMESLLYVQILDCRKKYPENMRFLLSYDVTNGEFASNLSNNNYAFVRDGWAAFMKQLTSNFQVYK